MLHIFSVQQLNPTTTVVSLPLLSKSSHIVTPSLRAGNNTSKQSNHVKQVSMPADVRQKGETTLPRVNIKSTKLKESI